MYDEFAAVTRISLRGGATGEIIDDGGKSYTRTLSLNVYSISILIPALPFDRHPSPPPFFCIYLHHCLTLRSHCLIVWHEVYGDVWIGVSGCEGAIFQVEILGVSFVTGQVRVSAATGARVSSIKWGGALRRQPEFAGVRGLSLLSFVV